MFEKQQIGGDVHRGLRLNLLAAQIKDRLAERRAGGIDEHIERASGAYHRDDRIFVEDIARDRSSANFIRERRECVLPTVGQRLIKTFASEPPCCRRAEPAWG